MSSDFLFFFLILNKIMYKLYLLPFLHVCLFNGQFFLSYICILKFTRPRKDIVLDILLFLLFAEASMCLPYPRRTRRSGSRSRPRPAPNQEHLPTFCPEELEGDPFLTQFSDLIIEYRSPHARHPPRHRLQHLPRQPRP